jgi:hypothetical protein
MSHIFWSILAWNCSFITYLGAKLCQQMFRLSFILVCVCVCVCVCMGTLGQVLEHA